MVPLLCSTGAGKTTLMDALAGLKTVGTLRGDIWVDGHVKQQDTFKRVCGCATLPTACLAAILAFFPFLWEEKKKKKKTFKRICG